MSVFIKNKGLILSKSVLIVYRGISKLVRCLSANIAKS